MISALIPAAGSGERLGSSGPKTLVRLAGRPMISWSIDALDHVAGVVEILVAAPPGLLARFEAIRSERPTRWKRTIEGGETRSRSVARLLDAASGSRVLIHDAARPCVDSTWVERLLRELGDAPAGVPAVRVCDTVKRFEAGTVIETLDREGLHLVQTPQVFETELLRRAHALAARDDVTDDATLVEALGVAVTLLTGDPSNLKVTFPGDLEVAAALLEARSRARSARPGTGGRS